VCVCVEGREGQSKHVFVWSLKNLFGDETIHPRQMLALQTRDESRLVALRGVWARVGED
jgi:hypothetical protein